MGLLSESGYEWAREDAAKLAQKVAEKHPIGSPIRLALEDVKTKIEKLAMGRSDDDIQKVADEK